MEEVSTALEGVTDESVSDALSVHHMQKSVVQWSLNMKYTSLLSEEFQTWNILYIDLIYMCKILHSVRKLTVTMGYTKMCTSYSGFMHQLWLASPDLAVMWQVKWQPVRNVSSIKNCVKKNYTWKLNINILFAMHHISNLKLRMLDNFNSWSDKHFLILILFKFNSDIDSFIFIS